ncbi:MAG: pyridoxamine 5'-phosphate oxidase family protein [Paracoccaceae bacterium]|nr:pyridoxamine 5'-phosphate oxidase family protein [Paracoccaceae bacterium]
MTKPQDRQWRDPVGPERGGNVECPAADLPPEDQAWAIVEAAAAGTLAVVEDGTDMPFASRVATGTASGGRVVLAVSALSRHTRVLLANPNCSLLLGEASTGGDPMAQPRLTLTGRARFIDRDSRDHAICRTGFLAGPAGPRHYVDFRDFTFAALEIKSAFLNAGFGKAFDIDPDALLRVAVRRQARRRVETNPTQP